MAGRRSRGTPVTLNVYDLSPSNQYLWPLGLGAYHSGVEVHGTEYSFADQGGIFDGPPRTAPGAQFREAIYMGDTDLSASQVRDLVSAMRPAFPGSSYNVLKRNCNTFANELCFRLVGREAPGYVNRFAYLGSFCSCLLPASMQDSAPVEPPSSSAPPSMPFRVMAPSRAAGARAAPSAAPAAAAGGASASASGWFSMLRGGAARPQRGLYQPVHGAEDSGASSQVEDRELRRQRLADAARRRMGSAEAQAQAVPVAAGGGAR